MREYTLKGMQGKLNVQFYSLLHRKDVWPKLLEAVGILAAITAVFAVSYSSPFSKSWNNTGGSNGDGTTINNNEAFPMVAVKIDTLKDATVLPESLTTLLTTNVAQDISTNKTIPSATQTSVQVNGSAIPISNNSSVHKVISTDDGNASVDISVQSNGSSSSRSSSLDFTVESSANTVSEGQ